VVIVGAGPVGTVLAHLLADYGVSSVCFEKRRAPTTHPQAHFVNARTMEVLQAHMPDVFLEVLRRSPPHEHWRCLQRCTLLHCIVWLCFVGSLPMGLYRVHMRGQLSCRPLTLCASQRLRVRA
jgi:hypothetical protein